MSSGGFVLVALAAVLVFCALIGVMVWAYSSQSAKRRKSQAEERTRSEGTVRPR